MLSFLSSQGGTTMTESTSNLGGWGAPLCGCSATLQCILTVRLDEKRVLIIQSYSWGLYSVLWWWMVRKTAHKTKTAPPPIPRWFCLWKHVCLCASVYEMFLYTSVHASLSAPLALAVGDGGAAAQFDDHLLAVVEGPFVSQLLQGAGCISQHSHPLTRCRQEGGREVATCQHHRLGLLPLAGPRLALLCTKKHETSSVKCWSIHNGLFVQVWWTNRQTNTKLKFWGKPNLFCIADKP